MRKEFDTFIESLQELPDGQECQLVIRDLTPGPRKYESLYVRAIVSSSPQMLPDGDMLWLRFPMGVLYPLPGAIKVVEELGEFMLE